MCKLQIMTQFPQLLNEAFDEESETFQNIRRHFYSLMVYDINTIDPTRFTFDLHVTFKTLAIFVQGQHSSRDAIMMDAINMYEEIEYIATTLIDKYIINSPSEL